MEICFVLGCGVPGCAVPRCEEFLNMLPCLRITPSFPVSASQVVFIAAIRGLDLIRGKQQRNRLRLPTGVKIKITELMICHKASGSAGECAAQLAFQFVRFPCGRESPGCIVCVPLWLECKGLTREIFACAQGGV